MRAIVCWGGTDARCDRSSRCGAIGRLVRLAGGNDGPEARSGRWRLRPGARSARLGHGSAGGGRRRRDRPQRTWRLCGVRPAPWRGLSRSRHLRAAAAGARPRSAADPVRRGGAARDCDVGAGQPHDRRPALCLGRPHPVGGLQSISVGACRPGAQPSARCRDLPGHQPERDRGHDLSAAGRDAVHGRQRHLGQPARHPDRDGRRRRGDDGGPARLAQEPGHAARAGSDLRLAPAAAVGVLRHGAH